jgi:Zn-dependent membrane protease YugP
VSVLWDSVGWELLSDVLVVSLSVELVEVVSVSLCVGFNPLIGITGVSTTITGAVTIGDTLMTLTGLVMFVGLVIDFTHESETTIQSFHKG